MKKKCRFRDSLLPACIAFLSMTLLSCRDQERINATQTFSSMVISFKSSSEEISNDIYLSCIRRAGYFNIDLVESRKNRKDVLESCELLYRPASVLAKDSSSIIIDYMLAVGNVLNVKFNTSEDLNRIKAALSSEQISLFKIDSSSLSAGIGIINFLLDLVIRRSQVDNLQLAIVCGDDSIQSYSMGLADAFQAGYIDGVLVDERTRIENYYSERATIMLSAGAEQIDFQVLEDNLADDTEKIVQRQRAGEDYIDLIGMTAKAHSELKEIFSDNKEVLDAECVSYFEEYRSSQIITPAKEREVHRVLENYQEKAEPLLENFKKDWPY